MEGTKPINLINLEGTRPNAYSYGGHPAPAGPALPNLKPYRIGGHNAYKYGGHPAPAGPALPNLKPYRIGGHNAYKYGGPPAPAGPALPNLLMRSKC